MAASPAAYPANDQSDSGPPGVHSSPVHPHSPDGTAAQVRDVWVNDSNNYRSLILSRNCVNIRFDNNISCRSKLGYCWQLRLLPEWQPALTSRRVGSISTRFSDNLRLETAPFDKSRCSCVPRECQAEHCSERASAMPTTLHHEMWHVAVTLPLFKVFSNTFATVRCKLCKCKMPTNAVQQGQHSTTALLTAVSMR